VLALKQRLLAPGLALLLALSSNSWRVQPRRRCLPPAMRVKRVLSALLRQCPAIQRRIWQDSSTAWRATSDDLRAKRWTPLSNAVRRGQSLLTSRRAS